MRVCRIVTPKLLYNQSQMAGKSGYTEELGERICEGLANGLPLTKVCAVDGMPSRPTIIAWSTSESLAPGFPDKYARARAVGIEVLAEEILEIADETQGDYVDRASNDGSTTRQVDTEHINRSRLRVDSRKWLLSKMNPSKWGDRATVDLNVSGTLNVADTLRAKRLKRLSADAEPK